MEDQCAGTHTQLRGTQEKACKAQRNLSCVSAVMVMWSLKNNLEKYGLELRRYEFLLKLCSKNACLV